MITRESARDRPLFAGMELSAEIGTLSVIVTRQPSEPMSTAVTEAARSLAAGLDSLFATDGGELRLTAVGRPVSRQSRLAVYLARRDRLWGSFEQSGVELPHGERYDRELEGDADELRFGGAIELASPNELPAALEITRGDSALVLGRLEHGKWDWETFLAVDTPEPKGVEELQRAAVGQLSDDLFAIRSFGWFDDVEVGSVVFAADHVLDRIESALAT
ncbi:hypothetical protein [Nocardia pseudobrasiliensis]|nr:hypothetical protein [Nocardia pseudobrasiliensis]